MCSELGIGPGRRAYIICQRSNTYTPHHERHITHHIARGCLLGDGWCTSLIPASQRRHKHETARITRVALRVKHRLRFPYVWGEGWLVARREYGASRDVSQNREEAQKLL
jgi:hypothetical protein